jgi:hypothetical protein
LEYSRYHLFSRSRLKKAMACSAVRRDVPPTIVITPAPKDNSVVAQPAVESALELDRLSPLLPSPSPSPGTDGSNKQFAFDLTNSLVERAYDGTTYIITTIVFTVFDVVPYLFTGSAAPFGLVGFILGVACIFCFIHLTLRNYTKQSWLRKNYPEAQDRRRGFCNGMTSIAALVSPLAWQKDLSRVRVF